MIGVFSSSGVSWRVGVVKWTYTFANTIKLNKEMKFPIDECEISL